MAQVHKKMLNLVTIAVDDLCNLFIIYSQKWADGDQVDLEESNDDDEDTDLHPKVVTPTKQQLVNRFVMTSSYSQHHLSLQESVDN